MWYYDTSVLYEKNVENIIKYLFLYLYKFSKNKCKTPSLSQDHLIKYIYMGGGWNTVS